jgi:regulator of sirC expression with transglutaminase-like and TPR domain
LSLVTILLSVLFSWPGGTPAVFAHCDEPSADSRRLYEQLDGIARLPNGDVALLPTILAASARGSIDLTGRPADGILVEKEVGRLAGRVSSIMGNNKGPRKIVSALNRAVFGEEKYTYDPVAGDPENYLLHRVVARKRGNCLGLTVLYLAVAERVGIPLHGSYVPSHCFVRYEENGARCNVEMGEKGAEREDGWYARKFGLADERPYLKTLGKREMVGVYLKSLAAAYSKKAMQEEALRLLGAAALYSPELPDVYFNAGVAYQKLGKTEDAIAHYRRALDLDPKLDSARGNLAAAFCTSGNVEEGIREYRQVLESHPGNVLAQAGLAKAYFARGDYQEAIPHCDKAREMGARFEPTMLEILMRYRPPAENSSRP